LGKETTHEAGKKFKIAADQKPTIFIDDLNKKEQKKHKIAKQANQTLKPSEVARLLPSINS